MLTLGLLLAFLGLAGLCAAVVALILVALARAALR